MNPSLTNSFLRSRQNIRQYFPKGSSFKEITPDKIKWVQDKLNNKPIKSLNYPTPNKINNIIINNEKVAIAA
jgi:IS30 family transposase